MYSQLNTYRVKKPRSAIQSLRLTSMCSTFGQKPSAPFLAHLSRRLIGELIVYPWSGVRRRPSVVRPSSVRRTSSTMLKNLLLRNRLADQSQILCGASLGRGNEILFATSGSHDQDGRHAHIWSKPFKNLLLQNRRADFHETWYVASGTPANHSLFK